MLGSIEGATMPSADDIWEWIRTPLEELKFLARSSPEPTTPTKGPRAALGYRTCGAAQGRGSQGAYAGRVLRRFRPGLPVAVIPAAPGRSRASESSSKPSGT